MSIRVFEIMAILAAVFTCHSATADEKGIYHGAGWGHAKVKGHGDGWGWGHSQEKGYKHGWGHQEVKGKGWESNYKFGYGVNDWHTGDVKTAYESRHEGWTKGSYSLLQPDGILRTVNYEADPWNGFKAVVHNKGWAKPKSHGWGHESNGKKTEGWSGTGGH